MVISAEVGLVKPGAAIFAGRSGSFREGRGSTVGL